MRKKVDSRIRTLVENCVKQKQRSLFVIVGDKGRDQVVNLHYMLSKTVVKARPSVLWCYKKELYLSSHKKKRMRQIKKMAQRGLLDPEQEDPFSLFVASTDIRYCYYHDTHKILGNTFGMCVLQDFEALTPNLLARTIETVEGGGIVVLLLSTLTSLTQLFSLTMDVHSRLRTESHQDVTGRFNERMVLSLASNPSCLLVDDELNILPTSSHVRNIEPLPADGQTALEADGRDTDLKGLSDSLADTLPAGPLVAKCKSLDQARAVMTFLDAASEKTLRSTVALTAARGRGKSAALGLAIAGALGLGYSNIFVTAPSPENLRTLFEFIFKGLDQLEYKEHLDYDLVESTNPAFAKAIVRVNVFKNHRQTVQYIQPQHAAQLSQAELLVIDEAAAIPLPVVKTLLGPYLVFLCSTVNGYEGTGRSLSLKLIEQLRTEGAKLSSGQGKDAEAGGGGALGVGGRRFREVQLQEPIRYAAGDKVESWLLELLCLNAAEHVPKLPARLPHPTECDLYYINRDTLFSYHKASEAFLQRMVALYASSHYKNTPNDLILMSDAPAHHLFALLGPVDETQNALPDVLCVVQVALEGAVSKKAALNSLAQGNLPQVSPWGERLDTWTIGQQFRSTTSPSLYGSRSIDLLKRYYQNELTDLSMDDIPGASELDGKAESRAESNHHTSTSGRGPRNLPETPSTNGGSAGSAALHSETLAPRSALPPLLLTLGERPPEALQYLGTSFGLTLPLFNFWARSGYKPVYVRQTASDITGEHTVVMLHPLQSQLVEGTAWLDPFVQDFRTRFLTLLSGAFRGFAPALALTILDPQLTFTEAQVETGVSGGDAIRKADGSPMSAYDLQRLQAYSNNLVDHHIILDLLPSLAQAYFSHHIPANLSYLQAAILLSLGLQQNDISSLESAIQLPPTQALALFNKAVRKLHGHLKAVKEAAVERKLPQARPITLTPQEQSLDEDLDEAAQAANDAMREALKPEDLQQYAIMGQDSDFEQALLGGAVPASGIVNVKSGEEKKVLDKGKPQKEGKLYKRDGKNQQGRKNKAGSGKTNHNKKQKT
ncbi:MAG: N-acetyltransferase 10 [Trebouxia sp. A1-2]|nr:MAG: N-acetyltransferase 10 [Trebouxia sp. A1-2]